MAGVAGKAHHDARARGGVLAGIVALLVMSVLWLGILVGILAVLAVTIPVGPGGALVAPDLLYGLLVVETFINTALAGGTGVLLVSMTADVIEDDGTARPYVSPYDFDGLAFEIGA